GDDQCRQSRWAVFRGSERRDHPGAGAERRRFDHGAEWRADHHGGAGQLCGAGCAARGAGRHGQRQRGGRLCRGRSRDADGEQRPVQHHGRYRHHRCQRRGPHRHHHRCGRHLQRSLPRDISGHRAQERCDHHAGVGFAGLCARRCRQQRNRWHDHAVRRLQRVGRKRELPRDSG
ncbi:hypothetical protein OY671_010567, partial [Metschnikowia pulcherrima]